MTTTTRRDKQPVNPLPEIGTRWCCDPGAPCAPPRIVVVDSVADDGVRNDKRIFYHNEATGRKGSTLFKVFASGAEFWPAPPVVAPTSAPVEAPAQPSAAAPGQGGQLPLLVSVHPADLLRVAVAAERIAVALEALVAVGGRIATVVEALAKLNLTSVPGAKPANDKAA